MDNENIMNVSASASKPYNFWKENVNRSINDSLKNDGETQISPYMLNEDVESFKIKKAASLKAFHLWNAVEHLCPQASNVAFQLARISGRQATQEHFACSLLEPDSRGDGTTMFTNRRMPEFLVAEYVAEAFLDKNPFRTCPKSRQLHYQLINFILGTCEGTEFHVRNKMFEQKMKLTSQWKLVGVEFSFAEFTFIESMTVGVLNNCMESIPTDVSFPEIPDLLNIFTNGAACKILTAAIISNSCGIIRLIRLILITVINNENKRLIQDSFICKFRSVTGNDIPGELSLSCYAYLCLTAKYSNAVVMEELESLLKTCLEVDVDQICSEMPPLMKTPLHFAVERHNYKMVEYFATKVSLSSRNILLYCVDSSLNYDEEKINIIMNVCQLLLQHTPALVHEECHNLTTHEDLIVFLAERGAFLHLTPQEAQYRTFPYLAASTIRRLYNVPGFDNVKDILLLEAVVQKEMVEVVEELLARGSDLFVRNLEYENLLHLALSEEAAEVARHLVSLGISLEDRDELGKTALLCAGKDSEMVEFIVSSGANMNAVNYHHENIAHLAIRCANDGLLTYLLSLPQAHALFEGKNCRGSTPLSARLENHSASLNVDTLKKMLSLPGFKVDEMDYMGKNYFLAAVAGQQDVEVLEALRIAGVKPTDVNKYGTTALHYAAKYGTTDIARYLLSLGLPIESRNKDGNTPLLRAKDLEMIKFFVSNNANVYAANVNGNNVAHLAVSGEDIETIAFLLGLDEAPTLFNSDDSKGCTPLQYLLQSDKNISEEMWDYFWKQSKRFLHIASYSQGSTLRSYLILKVDPERRTPNVSKGEIESLLDADVADITFSMAAKLGDVKKLQYLLSHENLKVSLERRNDDGETPLLASFPCGKAAKFLIEKGANIYALNGKGDNIAHKMNFNADDWAQYLILSKDAWDVFTMKNDQGRTPLHAWLSLSEMYVKPATVELILERCEMDINAEDTQGENIFSTAVKTGRSVELLRILYKFGANPKIVNKRGQNLLHIMSIEGSVRTVSYLASLGIPLEDPDHDGNTPFLLACKNPEVLTYLVSQGANIFATDYNGNNIAHKVGYFKINFPVDVSDLLEGSASLTLFLKSNGRGRTPLQLDMLSQEDNLNLTKIEMILNLPGVDVNARDEIGDTLLLSAVRSRRSVDVLNTLLQFGANPNAVNYAGQNSLHLVVGNMTPGGDTLDRFRFLVSIGCSTKQKDSRKRSLRDVIKTRKIKSEIPGYHKFCQDINEMIRILALPSMKRSSRSGTYTRLN